MHSLSSLVVRSDLFAMIIALTSQRNTHVHSTCIIARMRSRFAVPDHDDWCGCWSCSSWMSIQSQMPRSKLCNPDVMHTCGPLRPRLSVPSAILRRDPSSSSWPSHPAPLDPHPRPRIEEVEGPIRGATVEEDEFACLHVKHFCQTCRLDHERLDHALPDNQCIESAKPVQLW